MKKGPAYHVVQGCKFTTGFTKENIESGLSYQAKPDDLFIVTYPKNGTTWSQQIIMLILNKGEIPDVVKEKGIYGFAEISPFLECWGKKPAENLKRPGAIKTHLPYHIQPKHPNAKYIVVLRNAKDACVSFYYHQRMFPAYEFEGRSFHEFFPYWLEGETDCGDYFDWVLSWWKQRHNPNILFLLYEDMKMNTEANILRIAEFLDPKYKEELLENDCDILKKVMQKSSFDFMKETTNKSSAKKCAENPNVSMRVKEENYNFIRKGVVGDWKSHFTQEENRLLEEKFREKFGGTGLDILWEDYGVFGGGWVNCKIEEVKEEPWR